MRPPLSDLMNADSSLVSIAGLSFSGAGSGLVDLRPNLLPSN